MKATIFQAGREEITFESTVAENYFSAHSWMQMIVNHFYIIFLTAICFGPLWRDSLTKLKLNHCVFQNFDPRVTGNLVTRLGP